MMFKLQVLVFFLPLLLVHNIQAFPGGAGDCPEGVPAVGGSHLVANVLTAGTLKDAGITMEINGRVLEGTGYYLVDGVNPLTLTTTGIPFKGFLIRLGGGDSDLDTTTALTSTDEGFVQDATITCVNIYQVGGLTHNNRVPKTMITGELMLDELSENLPLDVTVVLENLNGFSTYYHSSFILNGTYTLPTEAPSEMPTIAPTELPSEMPSESPTESPAPTASPTEVPTPAPTEGPVIDTSETRTDNVTTYMPSEDVDFDMNDYWGMSGNESVQGDDMEDMTTYTPTDLMDDMAISKPADDMTTSITPMPTDEMEDMATSNSTNDMTTSMPTDLMEAEATSMPTDEMADMATAMPKDNMTTYMPTDAMEEITSTPVEIMTTVTPNDATEDMATSMPTDDMEVMTSTPAENMTTFTPTDAMEDTATSMPTGVMDDVATSMPTDDMDDMESALPMNNLTTNMPTPVDDDSLLDLETAITFDDDSTANTGDVNATIVPTEEGTAETTPAPENTMNETLMPTEEETMEIESIPENIMNETLIPTEEETMEGTPSPESSATMNETMVPTDEGTMENIPLKETEIPETEMPSTEMPEAEECPPPSSAGVCAAIFDPVQCGESNCYYSSSCLAILAGFQPTECMFPLPDGTMAPTEGETMIGSYGATENAPEVESETMPPTEETPGDINTIMPGPETLDPTFVGSAIVPGDDVLGVLEPTFGGAAEIPELSDGECSSDSPCRKCLGDCNDDSECEGELLCYRRPGEDRSQVPGCFGEGIPGRDYCIEATEETVHLRSPQCSDSDPCAACQGDCDTDSQCEGDLVCWLREVYINGSVPGCSGGGIPGLDYCHEPLRRQRQMLRG